MYLAIEFAINKYTKSKNTSFIGLTISDVKAIVLLAGVYLRNSSSIIC